MTVNYTTNLALGQPVTGTESGTWGDDVNNAVTSYLDIAISGSLALTSASFTANALTLANTQGNSSATNIGATTAQYYVLRLSSLAANVTITAPSLSKTYLIVNTDATYSATIKASGQTGISVAAGERATVYFSGTDYIRVTSSAITSLTGTLPVANGGTGLTAGASGGVLYYSAAGTLASSAALAASAIVLGGGAGVAPATTTTGTGVVTALGVNVGSAGAVVVNGGVLGTPSSGTVTNLTGTASININGTVGATTANTGSFTTLAATGDTRLATTAVLYSGNGGVSSGRLVGRYSYRNATPATAYFFDYNNSNTITSADSLSASRQATQIDNSANITNANALTAFGTNYGTKAAGLSFISGTASDVLSASVGLAPVLNADINAVVVGYTSNGPRILIQNYALNDDTADAINYVGAVHRFYPTNNAAVTISSTGLTVINTTGGLGYGTGSGGTVTQGTSRTTGVTLSKSNGAITMFSAAGSATAATFTVTNTLVAATDTIILNQKSGTNLYVLLVTAVAAGSFNITFYTTGGTATDAPVINFALIKAVTA